MTRAEYLRRKAIKQEVKSEPEHRLDYEGTFRLTECISEFDRYYLGPLEPAYMQLVNKEVKEFNALLSTLKATSSPIR